MGSNINYRSNYAKALLNQIKDQPEFVNQIEGLNFVDKNQDLIKYLPADLFPTELLKNEIKVATITFYDITLNYSELLRRG